VLRLNFPTKLSIYSFRWLLSGSAILSIPSCSSSLSIEHSELPPTNLEILVDLTKKIAQSFVRDKYISSQDTCSVQFSQIEGLRFIENAFLESLGNIPVYTRLSDGQTHGSFGLRNSVSMAIQPSRVDVMYEKVFRDGFFGEKKVVRVVTVELSTKIAEQPRGNVRYSGGRSEQWRDTVLFSTIEKLESPLITVTQASVPSQTLLDRLVEPIVVLAATGVVIYLFYTVRS
jgi:hypothetical protein